METNDKKTYPDKNDKNSKIKSSIIVKHGPSNNNVEKPDTADNASENNNKNTEKGSMGKWKSDTPANKIIAIFTILIGLTAIPLVITSICQIQASRQSITEAQNALEYTKRNDSESSPAIRTLKIIPFENFEPNLFAYRHIHPHKIKRPTGFEYHA